MDKIKSSYEIAMERAEKLTEEDESSEEENRNIEIRENLKPLMSKYFKEKIDAEELWQELKNKNSDYLVKAQEMIIESLGLRTSDQDFSRRKEGVLAIENLKSKPNSSIVEKILKKMKEVEKRHKEKREQMEEQFKQRMEQQSEMQMKPVQTEDGKTVMKLDSGVDKKAQQQMKQQLSQLEEQSEEMFNSLVEDLKSEL